MKTTISPGYATRSGWNALLPPRKPTLPLQGSRKVKYLVIGAGFAGLAAARRLAELDPDAQVLVLDAGTVGESASGRSSGFMQPYRLMESTSKTGSIIDFGIAGLEEVKRLIGELGIDCTLERRGSYRCSATERGEKELLSNRGILEKNKIAHRWLTREELGSQVGTSYYRNGLFIDGTYLIQPAAFVRGLADTLPPQVTLHEATPVLSLERTNGAWTAETSGGSVSASVVVLAANTFARDLGYLKPFVMAVYTYAGFTRVLTPSELATLGSDEVWGISPTFHYGTTMRRLANGRLLLRSLYSYESEMDEASIRKGLTTSLNAHFPQIADTEFEYVWAGIIAITHGKAPFAGKVGEGLYAMSGCNGSGIGKFSLIGKYMAEEIAGEHRLAGIAAAFGEPKWMPPDPFRYIGYKVASTVGKALAGKDI